MMNVSYALERWLDINRKEETDSDSDSLDE